MKLIKYKNRKIYNPEVAGYISLKEIKQAIRSGRSVTIIDNETKADITERVLMQIVLSMPFPAEVSTAFIRNSG